MVRHYKINGHKRKRGEEKYDKEESEDFVEEGTIVPADWEIGDKAETEDEAKAEDAVNQLAGIPIVPFEQNAKPGVIFILENASLEVAKVGKVYQLLNSDDHAGFLKRNNRNPADYRPDITHQALLAILDSQVNKAGRLRSVYVKTQKGVLFEVKPHVRIPRTFKRFSGIMSQLLQKLSITAVAKREKLLRVIKNPVTKYLPVNSHKIGFSYSSEKLVDIHDYVSTISNDINLVFVVGAMAHGKIDKEYADDYISISGYPLSAACCISEICSAVRRKWKIL